MFSETVVKDAWNRARAECECVTEGHEHQGRCGKTLIWEKQGQSGEFGGWETKAKQPLDQGGADDESNCQVVCWFCAAE